MVLPIILLLIGTVMIVCGKKTGGKQSIIRLVGVFVTSSVITSLVIIHLAKSFAPEVDFISGIPTIVIFGVLFILISRRQKELGKADKLSNDSSE